MNGFEWIARNAEFISAKAIAEAIGTFKEIAGGTAVNALKQSLVATKHTSEVMSTVASLLREASASANREQNEALLLVYLNLLEPLLLSDPNAEKAVQIGTLDILFTILSKPTTPPPQKKQALRCLTLIFRVDAAASFIVAHIDFGRLLTEVIASGDEENVLSATKIIRFALKHPPALEAVYRASNDTLQRLLANLSRFDKNEALLEETLSVIRIYTAKFEYLDHFKSASFLNKIIEICNAKENSRKKQIAVGILRNCQKNAVLANQIKLMGASETVNDPNYQTNYSGNGPV
eukprot:TRINITY_DN295_c0_g1_i3.p1 TRINITY_DN295_c0_g1~~TRINITY_DN295_c0_g1_i3.p1  ORF type:complete len:292 (+),score=70.54 TRINITY_DN295_c0_g1_i3:237-1112(+)